MLLLSPASVDVIVVATPDALQHFTDVEAMHRPLSGCLQRTPPGVTADASSSVPFVLSPKHYPSAVSTHW